MSVSPLVKLALLRCAKKGCVSTSTSSTSTSTSSNLIAWRQQSRAIHHSASSPAGVEPRRIINPRVLTLMNADDPASPYSCLASPFQRFIDAAAPSEAPAKRQRANADETVEVPRYPGSAAADGDATSESMPCEACGAADATLAQNLRAAFGVFGTVNDAHLETTAALAPTHTKHRALFALTGCSWPRACACCLIDLRAILACPAVCVQCRDANHDDYGLLSKSDVQRHFLLPEGTVAVLAAWERPNPRQRGFAPMKLYLAKQVVPSWWLHFSVWCTAKEPPPSRPREGCHRVCAGRGHHKGGRRSLFGRPARAWSCHMVLSHGFVTWFCHMVLSHGPVSWSRRMILLRGLVS